MHDSRKALAKEEKKNKEKYLQTCLESRHSFIHMVYSAGVIPGEESLVAHKRLYSHLSSKMKR